MLSKHKYHIIIVLAILVIAIVWYRRRKKLAAEKAAADMQAQLDKFSQPSSGTGQTVATPPGANAFPLKVGSKGQDVIRLQRALNRIQPSNKIAEDGSFQNATATKLVTSVATSLYSTGPSVTEAQLNKLISLGNQA